MAGGKTEYNEELSEIVPKTCPPHLSVAGRAAGIHTLDKQITQGEQAGLYACNSLGTEKGDPVCTAPDITSESYRTSARVSIPGNKKGFVCFCEDVSDRDIETAITEGYDSIELLKRYSTISMGPCQGKMCSMNTIHLCARTNNRTVRETGKTTARPPIEPIALGTLAGQKMEPVQVTPLHTWHMNRGAKIMVAGQMVASRTIC